VVPVAGFKPFSIWFYPWAIGTQRELHILREKTSYQMLLKKKVTITVATTPFIC
jgi:hypothetical protein